MSSTGNVTLNGTINATGYLLNGVAFSGGSGGTEEKACYQIYSTICINKYNDEKYIIL